MTTDKPCAYRAEDTAHPAPEFHAASIFYDDTGFRGLRMTAFTCWHGDRYIAWLNTIDGARTWCAWLNRGRE